MTESAQPPSPPEWKNLNPGRSLGFGDTYYVPRPEAVGGSGSERLVSLVRAGRRAVVVAGPAGSGKSTELAVAAGLLQKEMVVCPVPLDRLGAVHNVATDEALQQIAGHLAAMALSLLRIKLSSEIKRELVAAGVLNTRHANEAPDEPSLSGAEMVLRVAREVRRIGRRGQTVLLIDGLEKCPEATAREVALALLAMRDEIALVIVAPPALVVGPASYDVVSQVRVLPLRALPVRKEAGAPWQVTREWFRAVVLKRLGIGQISVGLRTLLDEAVDLSGGVLGGYLQLLSDAAGYAQVMGRESPASKDLSDAARDLSDVLVCLLRDGDIAALGEADGTSGIEVPLDRRLRFLQHGLLLEYDVHDRLVVHPAPLLRIK